MFPLFNTAHGFEVLMLPGQIRDPGIAEGHFDLLVAKQLLQNFKAHTGIEHIGGKGVPEAVQAVSFSG